MALRGLGVSLAASTSLFGAVLVPSIAQWKQHEPLTTLQATTYCAVGLAAPAWIPFMVVGHGAAAYVRYFK